MISIWAIFCGCYLVIINKFLRYFKLLLLLLEPLFQHALKHCLVRAFNFLDALFDKNYSLEWDLLKCPRFFLRKLFKLNFKLSDAIETFCNLVRNITIWSLYEQFLLVKHLVHTSCEKRGHLVYDNFSLIFLMMYWLKISFFDVAFLLSETICNQSLDFTLF